MNDYQKSILAIVCSIPEGKVMSYGQVAACMGRPKEAREVGWTMQKLDADFPWWRVLNNAGVISIKDNPDADADMQKQLLEEEGVVVNDELTLDINTYRYCADESALKALHLDPEQIKTILAKYKPSDKTDVQQLALF